MIYLNIITDFDGGLPRLVLAIGGLVLFIYIIFSRRFLSKKKYGKALYQQDNAVVEKDVLGMDKAIIEDTDAIDNNIGKDKSIKVKTVLLIILIIIGLYLVIFYR
jgi:hypothetical protein